MLRDTRNIQTQCFIISSKNNKMLNKPPTSLFQISTIHPHFNFSKSNVKNHSQTYSLKKKQYQAERSKSIGIRTKFVKNLRVHIKEDGNQKFGFQFQGPDSDTRVCLTTLTPLQENKMSSYQLYKYHQKNDKIKHHIPLNLQKHSNNQLPITLRVRQDRHRNKSIKIPHFNKSGSMNAAIIYQKSTIHSRHQTLQNKRKSYTSGLIRHKKFSFDPVTQANSICFQTNQFRPWSPKFHYNCEVEACPEIFG